jgi:hypothetical protein
MKGALTVCVLAASIAAARAGHAGEHDSPLAAGQVLPAGISSLVGGECGGHQCVWGTFERDGKTVAFKAVRGAQLHAAERQPEGRAHYEMDVCFTDATHQPIWSAFGGDAALVPECDPERVPAAAGSDVASGRDRSAEYRLVADAMHALRQVRFDARFTEEHRALTDPAEHVDRVAAGQVEAPRQGVATETFQAADRDVVVHRLAAPSGAPPSPEAHRSGR